MPKETPFLFDIPSVSELTHKIKDLLEQNFVDILVEGECSNVKQSRNGHIYFVLKDDTAQLPCVIWRSTAERLGLDLRDGQQIVAGGDIQVYPPHGKYQMIVSLVQQAGIGKLQQAFEKLKEKLKSEGLFEDDHKKPLPSFPQKIGVVTSSTSAAFQDIRSTLEKRWPVAEIHLYHASTQGMNAAPEIVKGIQYFSDSASVDVVIIGRGGGSLEDLWPFNEESVARAVYASRVPIISAVGHEVDFSISDFVADSRAATPTHAAVLAVPDINEIRFQIEDYSRKLEQQTLGAITLYKERVASLSRSHALRVVQQKMEQAKSRITSLTQNMEYRLSNRIRDHKEKLTGFRHILEMNDPNEALKKGYVRVLQDERWIRNMNDFERKSDFELQWEDGKISSKDL
ncbi:exodeoxyribonuclease VII large subunit [Balneola sp. MJW-20]|uniref:exodeoxyribonuclease VII large subunit n=1 Tax=Gracilimonas aurantiaca TaxID=3234185 RepID=UPI003467064B